MPSGRELDRTLEMNHSLIKLTRFSPSEGEEAEAGPFLFNPAP